MWISSQVMGQKRRRQGLPLRREGPQQHGETGRMHRHRDGHQNERDEDY
jgi:hypothetical protein